MSRTIQMKLIFAKKFINFFLVETANVSMIFVKLRKSSNK